MLLFNYLLFLFSTFFSAFFSTGLLVFSLVFSLVVFLAVVSSFWAGALVVFVEVVLLAVFCFFAFSFSVFTWALYSAFLRLASALAALYSAQISASCLAISSISASILAIWALIYSCLARNLSLLALWDASTVEIFNSLATIFFWTDSSCLSSLEIKLLYSFSARLSAMKSGVSFSCFSLLAVASFFLI